MVLVLKTSDRNGYAVALCIFSNISSRLDSCHRALHNALPYYMGLSYLQTAEALSSVLKSNDTLREIDLSGNALGVEGGRSLREALTENMYAHRLPAVVACQKKCALHHLSVDAHQFILSWFSTLLFRSDAAPMCALHSGSAG